MAYSPLRHMASVLRKGNPVQLTFFLTKRCNARCSFCFYQSVPNSPAERTQELTLEEIEKISASMGSLLWLAFSGGEIFLREDLIEIAGIFYARNKPSIILLPTNGILTEVIREKTESILKQCRKSTIVVKLSLDGPEEVHDALRGREGSYRETLQTYGALSGLIDTYPNFELGVNTVFCSANQDRMEEIIGFVRGLDKVRTHTVSLIRGQGLKEIDMEKYRETISILAENLKKNKSGIYRFRGSRLKAAQDILQRRLIYETETQIRQVVPCYAGKLNLVLTEKGDLYPCESFTMKMGNLRDTDYDMEKILRSPRALNIIRSIRDKGCFCSHECYMMTNILFNPRKYPALIKEYLQLR